MAIPVLDCRLRIPSYRNQAGTDTRQVVFALRAERVIKQVERPVRAISTFGSGAPGEIIAIDLNRYKETLLVSGKAFEEQHPNHPVVGGTVHDPDFIDLEEATILWPTRVDTMAQVTPIDKRNLIELWMESFGSSFRVYKGDILALDTVREPGHRHINFTLVFGVVVGPSPREWVPAWDQTEYTPNQTFQNAYCTKLWRWPEHGAGYTLYLAVASTGSTATAGVYQSTDKGDSWTLRFNIDALNAVAGDTIPQTFNPDNSAYYNNVDGNGDGYEFFAYGTSYIKVFRRQYIAGVPQAWTRQVDITSAFGSPLKVEEAINGNGPGGAVVVLSVHYRYSLSVYGAFLRSIDNFGSYTRISNSNIHQSNSSAEDIRFPSYPTGYGCKVSNAGWRAFKTTDGGASWIIMPNISILGGGATVWAPDVNSILVENDYSSAWKLAYSSDGAVNWTQLNPGGIVNELSPTQAKVMSFAKNWIWAFSKDNSDLVVKAWINPSPLTDDVWSSLGLVGYTFCDEGMGLDETDDNVIFAWGAKSGGNRGFMRSVDQGVTWVYKSQGLPIIV